MDNIFLKEMALCYESDRNLKNIQEEIFNFLVNTRSYLKETELPIYEEIQYNYTRLNQQKLIYSLLDDKYIKEDLGVMIGAAALVSAGLFLQKLFDGVDHGLSKLFTSLQKKHLDIRKDLKDSSLNKRSEEYADRYQLMEKMLDSSYSNCTKMCGVADMDSINKEDVRHYMSVLFNPGEERKYLSPRHAQEANCLVSCYLDYITSCIAELNLLYMQCMQKTGEYPVDSGATKAIAPVGSKCDQIRKDVNDLKSEFDKFLKYLYKNNPRYHSLWVDMLHKKLNDVQNNKKVTNYSPHLLDVENPMKLSLGL